MNIFKRYEVRWAIDETVKLVNPEYQMKYGAFAPKRFASRSEAAGHIADVMQIVDRDVPWAYGQVHPKLTKNGKAL